MADVVIIMGSKSDEEKVAPCMHLLRDLGISFSVTVCSAHRTASLLDALIREEEKRGCQIFICAAGMGAHLAGAVAARTVRPVIGIPIAGKNLAGLDALLSTVQMPPGYPVATVALDGAKNAAWLAVQILGLQRQELQERILAKRKEMQRMIQDAAAEIAQKYN